MALKSSRQARLIFIDGSAVSLCWALCCFCVTFCGLFAALLEAHRETYDTTGASWYIVPDYLMSNWKLRWMKVVKAALFPQITAQIKMFFWEIKSLSIPRNIKRGELIFGFYDCCEVLKGMLIVGYLGNGFRRFGDNSVVSASWSHKTE